MLSLYVTKLTLFFAFYHFSKDMQKFMKSKMALAEGACLKFQQQVEELQDQLRYDTLPRPEAQKAY